MAFKTKINLLFCSVAPNTPNWSGHGGLPPWSGASQSIFASGQHAPKLRHCPVSAREVMRYWMTQIDELEVGLNFLMDLKDGLYVRHAASSAYVLVPGQASLRNISYDIWALVHSPLLLKAGQPIYTIAQTVYHTHTHTTPNSVHDKQSLANVHLSVWAILNSKEVRIMITQILRSFVSPRSCTLPRRLITCSGVCCQALDGNHQGLLEESQVNESYSLNVRLPHANLEP